MTTIYLLRHAEPDFSVHEDAIRPLTPNGIRSCEDVTKYFSDKQIDMILSSPFKRAIDTINNFSDQFQIPMRLVDDFRERAVGIWVDNFTEYTKKQWQDFTYKLEGGECLWEVQKRNIDALSKVLMEYRDKNIVISSHGTAISTIINYYDKTFGIDDFNRIKYIMPFIIKMKFDKDDCISIEMAEVENKDDRR